MSLMSGRAHTPRRLLLATAAAALLLTGAAAAVVSRQDSKKQDSRQQSSQQRDSRQRDSRQRRSRHESRETPAGLRVENFGRVNENYYRGGQPRAEEYAVLRTLGVKTVVDLREDSKRDAPSWARDAGLRYFNIPLRAGTPATEAETEEFLKLVNDPSNWPVYVHCKGGRHRTGALTAVYRITQDGWTADQAYQEMLEYDFDNSVWGGGGRARQKRYVYDFYERRRAAAEQKK
ncbi:MAG TPA: tyrosine-protein phosphatase [Pyrinomonadaceae bacterium]|nr:tyrosine-protein phosphatase [Pyrinomonadaceae bacterium]